MKTVKHSHRMTTLFFSLSLLFLVLSNNFYAFLSPGAASFMLLVVMATFITSFFMVILKIIVR